MGSQNMKVFKAAAAALIICTMSPSISAQETTNAIPASTETSALPVDVFMVSDNNDGLTIVETRPGVEPEEPWQWASATKQIIAVLIMQEVEAGRLSLDDTLDVRLPDYSKRKYDRITLRDLLMHTSGLKRPNRLPNTGTDPVAFCATKAGKKPGQKFAYNNCDTVLAAAVLERVTGEPWIQTAQAKIFDIAGMAQTKRLTAPVTDGSVMTSGMPHLYGAAGALAGPPGDLLKFNEALMRGDLLKEQSLQTLWQSDPSKGYVALGVWVFSAPLKGCDGSVKIVERRGHIGNIQVRNMIAPDFGRSFVAFADNADLDYGEIWMGAGVSYDLASRAFCI